MEHTEDNLQKKELLPAAIQFKMLVGAPDDPAEQEADAVANIITRMPEQSFIGRKPVLAEGEDKVQRKPLVSFIQRKESASAAVAPGAVSDKVNASRGN